VAGLRIAEVLLAAPRDRLAALERFYGAALGLGCERDGDRLAVSIGPDRMAFAGVEGAPFYHVAFLVARRRFDLAHAWLGERTELLPAAKTGETIFEFGFWNARAFYSHDPAGNILELIGHPEADAEAPDGPFGPEDLLAISEVGLVTRDPYGAAQALERGLGLAVWSGEVRRDGPSFGFVGRKAHTLILSPPDRGWLPTGRPSEPHPVEVTVSGVTPGEVRLPGSPHVVRGRA
jgi:catechol-2,3-dioxygenase